MKIYQIAVSVVTISMICLSGADAYQIQKWVDKDGKVHYGDKTVAPQTSQSMQINVKEGRELKAAKPPQEAEKKKKPVDEKIEPSDVASASCIGFARKILALKMDPSIDPQDDSKKLAACSSIFAKPVQSLRSNAPSILQLIRMNAVRLVNQVAMALYFVGE